MFRDASINTDKSIKDRLYECHSNLHLVETTQLTQSTQMLTQTNFIAWNKKSLNLSLTSLSETLSDIFRKQRFWLVRDDIITLIGL